MSLGAYLAVGRLGRLRSATYAHAVRYVAGVVVVTLGCWIAGELGSALLIAGAGAFWPATGVAVAVLYLGGLRWWPAVMLGDFLSNSVGVGALPLVVKLPAAAGNATSAVVSVVILVHLIGPCAAMDRLRHVGAVLVAVGTGEAIGATVGTLAERAGDLVERSEMLVFWRSWWLGGLAGGLVVAPLAMAWASPRAASWPRRRIAEGALMVAAVAGLSVLALSAKQPVTYAVFPALIWSALRLGPQGATLAVATATCIAVWMTANDLEPFVEHSPTDRALNIQLYIVVGALTTLCLAAIVSERRRASREVVESRARLAAAGDRERRKLERDLHDGAQQRLIAIQIKLRLIKERVGDPELAAELDAIGEQAVESVEELRALAHGIYPPVLRHSGVVDALRAFAMTAQVPIEIVEEGIGRCSPEVEAAIYFCAMEAVQNVTKHAGGHARVTIALGRDRERVHFAVADDGVGMDDPLAAAGEGLTSMRDRIGAVNGELQITSAPGHGTTVTGTVRPGQSETPLETTSSAQRP